jgi:glucose-6-phosphate 1-dehydrogenase
VTPDLVIALGSHVKVAGEGLLGKQVELVVSASSDPLEMEAYGELLGDALAGNSSRFARQDYVEEAWRIVDPVLLDDATPVHLYSPGTWGPKEAEAFLEIDFGGEDLAVFVVNALDFHLEAGDEDSHCQLFSTGVEQSADLGYFGGVGQLKSQFSTAPKLHDDFVAASAYDETFDFYVFGDNERSKNQDQETQDYAGSQVGSHHMASL